MLLLLVLIILEPYICLTFYFSRFGLYPPPPFSLSPIFHIWKPIFLYKHKIMGLYKWWWEQEPNTIKSWWKRHWLHFEKKNPNLAAQRIEKKNEITHRYTKLITHTSMGIYLYDDERHDGGAIHLRQALSKWKEIGHNLGWLDDLSEGGHERQCQWWVNTRERVTEGTLEIGWRRPWQRVVEGQMR